MYFIYLLWYFIIFSFLGWLFSCLYNLISERKFYNKGFLTLPFCPAYGFGGVLCYAVFSRLTDNTLIIFIGSALLLSLFCVLSGQLFEKILGCKPWDYSHMRFCIGSFITLPFAAVLGAAGAFAVKLLIPMFNLWLATMPEIVSVIISLSIFGVIVIDSVFSLITVIRLRNRLRRLKNLAEVLPGDVTPEQAEELEHNYNTLFRDKILRVRMVQAFPDLTRAAYVRQAAEKLGELKKENMKQYAAVYEKPEDKPFASGLCVEKLFALFLIGSFVGTCIETVFAIIVEGHFECRVGVVYGPFIPVYGGGACLLTLVLYKLYKLSDTLVFIISAALGAFFEYVCSWGQETFLGTVSWDYSDMPLNINGRTSLLYSCFWGFLGLIWLRYLYPFASKQIEKIPKKQGSVVLMVLFVFMLYNAFITVTSIYRWNQRVEGVSASNSFEYYLDNKFNDERMELLFPHMRDSDDKSELKDNKSLPMRDDAIIEHRK